MAVLRGTAGNPPPALLPEIQAVLRMTLGPPESRYASSGDLRRELGKLLFSGPYSPSTFNLAYFLNDLFKDEIEVEMRARKRESVAGVLPATLIAPAPRPPAPAPRPEAVPTPEPAAHPARSAGAGAGRVGGRSRTSLWAGLRSPRRGWRPLSCCLRARPPGRPPRPPSRRRRRDRPRPHPDVSSRVPETPAGPTNGMSEAQLGDEVAPRRLRVQKLRPRWRAAVPRGRSAEPAVAPTARARRPEATAVR
jgi:hypothetical protein